MASLLGKVFAITGGASGMGLATVHALTKKGARAICIGDFNDSNFASIKADIDAMNTGSKVRTTKLDVASSASVMAWVEGIVSEFGALDGAFNAAGVPQGPTKDGAPALVQETDESWNRVVSINLTGLFYSCREEVKAMLKLSPSSRSIVNVSSMSPFAHSGHMHAYGSSNSGVHYFSENLANDLRPYGIRVNSVCPGLTETPMMDVFVPKDMPAIHGYRIPKSIKPSDVADTVLWLLEDEARQVSGVHIPIGPGMP